MDGSSQSSAKVYSNLAAALCKMNKYDDAYDAAKKCTEVDPAWAKGFWRLGVTEELQKDFIHALDSYTKAVEINPEEATFIKAVSYNYSYVLFTLIHAINTIYLMLSYIHT